MLLANHVSEKLEITDPNNKLDCWVQEKRVLTDLIRNDHNSEVPLNYLPIFEAPQVSEVNVSIPTTSTPPSSLPSSVAMGSEIVTTHIPTKVTRTKISKSKSKKTSFVVSQKTTVATTTTTVGSVQGDVSVEGRGEHQRNPQDKVGEVSES